MDNNYEDRRNIDDYDDIEDCKRKKLYDDDCDFTLKKKAKL